MNIDKRPSNTTKHFFLLDISTATTGKRNGRQLEEKGKQEENRMRKNELVKQLVSISTGNRKMGEIPSVSLPPIVTCKNCATCAKKCYAAKLCRIYKSVREAYERNLDILKNDRDSYFEQVTTACKMTRYFRFHVSGDIIDVDYLYRMVKVARTCKNTEILAFTKNYEDCNAYFENHRKPRNLHLIYSLPFNGATIENPHNMPTAAVILRGEDPKANYKVCGGNCTECACKGVGCWELKKGETIAFYEH